MPVLIAHPAGNACGVGLAVKRNVGIGDWLPVGIYQPPHELVRPALRAFHEYVPLADLDAYGVKADECMHGLGHALVAHGAADVVVFQVVVDEAYLPLVAHLVDGHQGLSQRHVAKRMADVL